MNKSIINEFERLAAFINEEIDKSIAGKAEQKVITANQFRLKQIKNVTSLIKQYPKEITLDNYLDLKDVKGIGKGSLERIKEILMMGKLYELKDFVDVKKEKTKSIEELESVVGIGHSKAIELYNQGIKTVKELKKQIKLGKIEVNDKVELGLKYYGKFEGNIPRKEITKIYKIFGDIIKELNKNQKKSEQFIFEFCGSYRREKPTSGDIDILISKLGNINENNNYLENLIKLLKQPIKKNDDNPLLIDDLTEFGKTKYMGFGKYKENPVRRIDIRFVPYESYFSALVYFTGSAELNKKMRVIAKSKKLKLSEYGLFKENGEMLPIKSERDIFDILNIEYLLPRLR
jgi:DNA polymerase/3'-5' exonuclease PolX